jgi:hypothetical protein
MKRVLGAWLLLSSLLVQTSCAQPEGKPTAAEDFQAFWSEFRAAVLANDTGRVASLTQFPFRTRGQLDSDPVTTHDQASFVRNFTKLLDQDPGLAREPDTMRHVIERKTSVTGKDLGLGGASARVANFEFRRVEGRWRFTLAYVGE